MLSFDFKCPYTLLSGYLDYAIDNAFGNDKYETHGVTLKLQRRGDSFLNIDGNIIFINTIADIEVYKSVGLFSSEIKGVIDINLAIEYDISTNFRITTKSEILNHKWIEKPTLEIGILNMPVESLVELALKHYEGIITAKMDGVVRDNIDLKSIINAQLSTMKANLNEKSFHGIKLNVNPTMLVLEKPIYKDNIIHLAGGVVVDTAIAKTSNLIEAPLTFKWTQQLEKDSLILTSFELDEPFLLEMVESQIGNQEVGGKPLQISHSNIAILENKVEFKSTLLSPIRAGLKFNASPIYVEAKQELILQDINVEITPESFLYKLSAPLVNKFIENKLEGIFPLKIKSLIDEKILKQIPEIMELEHINLTPVVKSINLSKLSFKEGKVIGIVRIENPHFTIVMQEQRAVLA